MKIYHNPKCSKSRQAKQILDQQAINYDVCLYLDNPLTAEELKELLKKLKLSIKDIIRTKEELWKEKFKGNEYSEEQLIKIVAENPKLLERPIIEHKDFAVVARSEDKIAKILNTY
ncbi:arsenate reductase (glutaredoxin) [Allofrancisella guangzhouensis]|uniref:Arsenate reductase n=1 Tax=Allofrancisella guangzhouensis TaxID=594679 RepID=A0A0A8E531_9GAMM|nr:arsenate reductase (glutaredoxin) [Allofrancisella guangzhouensis]AJC49350.1 arsenate reductase [Allofrancisella guangzhouensis]MBK2027010.1 arsenate reductase (glutaredoxin) [Allofrancisella guangzhouensis]MBK2043918.1 arsenate reductase (glutaredoxin) [Allofrancisella guangzhouensis]MBK2044969.1 arsenate reductase (glutaredoxin) [Allofrancisella guangzhouensis]